MNPTWDERYSSCAYAHGTESNTLVAAMASRIPAGLVLCLAEGEGRNAVHLARLGHAVTAGDQSSVASPKPPGIASR